MIHDEPPNKTDFIHYEASYYKIIKEKVMMWRTGRWVLSTTTVAEVTRERKTNSRYSDYGYIKQGDR